MAEPALAYPPRPCPALDAILALHEDSLPGEDGQPMPDVDEQERPLNYSRYAIRRHLRGVADDVAVYGDMFVYYIGRDEMGEPVRRSVAPDVFAVFGTPYRLNRRSYVLWDEPEADIRFVLEIASSSTRGHDHGAKRDIYASLGVREYFLFDPPGRRSPALVGLRLRDGVYREIAPSALPDGRPGVRSDVVGLVGYVADGGRLRWFDPAAGEDLREFDEHADMADAYARRAAVAERRAAAAERRVAELEALLPKR